MYYLSQISNLTLSTMTNSKSEERGEAKGFQTVEVSNLGQAKSIFFLNSYKLKLRFFHPGEKSMGCQLSTAWVQTLTVCLMSLGTPGKSLPVGRTTSSLVNMESRSVKDRRMQGYRALGPHEPVRSGN